MTNRVQKIIAKKKALGPGAYLWLHTSGDCILWASEDLATDDDGARAEARWRLTSAEADELHASREVDELA